MSFEQDQEGSDEDMNGLEGQRASWEKHDAVLFAIDCFRPEASKYAFNAVLHCIRSKMWASSGLDMVGIVLYNIQGNINTLSVPGVNIALMMSLLSVDSVRRANSLESFHPKPYLCELTDLLSVITSMFDTKVPS